jgi:hypothetical protein
MQTSNEFEFGIIVLIENTIKALITLRKIDFVALIMNNDALS